MHLPKLLFPITCALVLATLSLLGADAPRPAEQFAQTRDKLLTKAGSAALNADEHFSLAMSMFGLGQFREALVVARLGAGLTQNPIEKSVFYMAIAQCHGAMGDYGDAGAAALAGQRLNPLSRELAALRLAYFSKYDDKAQAKAAEDTLKQMCPSGIPVLTSDECWAWIVTEGAAKLDAIRALWDIAKVAWERLEPVVQDLKRDLEIWWSNAKSDGKRPTGNVRIR